MHSEGNDVSRVAAFFFFFKFFEKLLWMPDFSRTFYQVLKSFITLVLCEKSK